MMLSLPDFWFIAALIYSGGIVKNAEKSRGRKSVMKGLVVDSIPKQYKVP
jgi:hypothetical protein